jgi:hypothetical protein
VDWLTSGNRQSPEKGLGSEQDLGYAIDPVDVDLHVQQALERSVLLPDGRT